MFREAVTAEKLESLTARLFHLVLEIFNQVKMGLKIMVFLHSGKAIMLWIMLMSVIRIDWFGAVFALIATVYLPFGALYNTVESPW